MKTSEDKQFEELLAALAKEIGVAELKIAEDGICRLQVDAFPVSMIRQAGAILMYAVIGTLPEEKNKLEKVYSALLSGNSLFSGTYGAVLGIMPENKSINIAYQYSMLEPNVASFLLTTENFFHVAELWSKQIQDIVATPVALAPRVSTNISESENQQWVKV